MAKLANHHTKKYRHIREVCLWLHDYKCYLCKKNIEPMETHHIGKQSGDDRLENLIPVCKEHHKLLGRTARLKELEKSYIIQLLKLRLEILENSL